MHTTVTINIFGRQGCGQTQIEESEGNMLIVSKGIEEDREGWANDFQQVMDIKILYH